MKFHYGVSTSIGGTSDETNFKEDIEVILTKENNFTASSKLRLPDIETSTSGKVIGFRMTKRFESLESKIFIKSIEEL